MPAGISGINGGNIWKTILMSLQNTVRKMKLHTHVEE
jgi:hypothetical protein